MKAKDAAGTHNKEMKFDEKGSNPFNKDAKAGVAGACSKCKTPIPAKPGFRPSALKCPKCGAAPAK